MPEYWYSALTSAGAVQEGQLNARDENALAEQLRAAGAFLIRTELRGGSRVTGRPAGLTDGSIDRKSLLAFFEYVAGSFEVGIPILDALDDVVNRLQSRRLRQIVAEMRFAVSD